MRKILTFLAEDGAFIYEDFNCRIVDSEYIDTFGGTGSVTLRNKLIEVKLWLDRDILVLDIRSASDTSPHSWVSLDILKQLLSGNVESDTRMTHENVAFVRSNFSKLQVLFGPENSRETQKKCRELETQRSKRLFG